MTKTTDWRSTWLIFTQPLGLSLPLQCLLIETGMGPQLATLTCHHRELAARPGLERFHPALIACDALVVDHPLGNPTQRGLLTPGCQWDSAGGQYACSWFTPRLRSTSWGSAVPIACAAMGTAPGMWSGCSNCTLQRGLSPGGEIRLWLRRYR